MMRQIFSRLDERTLRHTWS